MHPQRYFLLNLFHLPFLDWEPSYACLQQQEKINWQTEEYKWLGLQLHILRGKDLYFFFSLKNTNYVYGNMHQIIYFFYD